MPGLVDIHGDPFEPQIQPRPGVNSSIDLGLRKSDRQVVVCGHTTSYHALTLPWELGLRRLSVGRAIIDCIGTLGEQLRCDTRAHVR